MTASLPCQRRFAGSARPTLTGHAQARRGQRDQTVIIRDDGEDCIRILNDMQWHLEACTPQHRLGLSAGGKPPVLQGYARPAAVARFEISPGDHESRLLRGFASGLQSSRQTQERRIVSKLRIEELFGGQPHLASARALGGGHPGWARAMICVLGELRRRMAEPGN
jgi:hypothetical protein